LRTASHFFHLMLPPLFPWLMKDFALSYTDVGLLTTRSSWSAEIQALAGLWWIAWVRRVLFFGWRAVVFRNSAGLSTSYPMLLLTAAVAGAGNSIFHPADFTLLNSEIAPSRLGHAFSVHGLSGSLGWAVAPVFMAGTASLAGWHVAGFAIAAVGAVVLTLLWFRRGVLEQAAVELVVAARGKSERASRRRNSHSSRRTVWLCLHSSFSPPPHSGSCRTTRRRF
jgi:predicted MFS family arabinose efflux permease